MSKRSKREVYSEKIASEILDRLADGSTLTSICEEGHLPSRITVWRWTQGRNGAPEEFRLRYLEARTAQADKFFDEIMRVARETMASPSNDRTNANRLFVDTVKWSLAKMRPNVYGDQSRLHLGADPQVPPMAAPKTEVNLNVLDKGERAKLRELGRKLIVSKGEGQKAARPVLAGKAEG